jgi:outer membrane cobalamin receptor
MTRPRAGTTGRLFGTTLFALIGFVAAATPVAAEQLRVRAVDPQDRAVALADVIVMQGSRVVRTVTTAADGRIAPIDLPPGDYEIVVSAPGLRSEPQKITITSAPGTRDLDVRLALAAVRESVVVSASQVDARLSRVPDSVTVIDRAELRARQSETVADAIRRVPGFGVVQSGGRGAVTSFFPRGGESDYTLVLVDGIQQNAFGGGFDAAHLGVADVERVEVVRGPQSALFGGGAIGGVVQVITRAGGPTRADGLIEAGGYGTTRTYAGGSGSRGAWQWGAAIDWIKTDGDTRTFNSIGGPVTNDDYERTAGSFGVGWSDRPDRRARVNVRIGHDERGNPGAYGSNPLGLDVALDTISRGTNDTRGVGAQAVFGQGRPRRHSLQFTWTDAPSHFVSPFGDSDDETTRVTGRYQFDLERQTTGFSAGWEGLAERADNTFITDASFAEVPVERSLNGFFAEARWRPTPRGVVHGGLRVERIARRAMPGDAFGSRPALEEDVVWSANPKVMAAWFLTDPGAASWTRVHGGAGTGIKPPTAFEIAFTDNPSLRPERSRSFDAGIEHARRGGALVFDATWFANRYDQLIVTVGTSMQGASRYQTDNIANASARGLELSASWRGPRGLAARGAWTWMHSEVRDIDKVPGVAPPPYSVGDALIRRPANHGSADIAWSNTRARVGLSFNGRGAMRDIEPYFAGSVFNNPGYVTAMLAGSFTLTSNIEIYGRVTNLFDRSYEEALGYPALGRAAMVGLRLAGSR